MRKYREVPREFIFYRSTSFVLDAKLIALFFLFVVRWYAAVFLVNLGLGEFPNSYVFMEWDWV